VATRASAATLNGHAVSAAASGVADAARNAIVVHRAREHNLQDIDVEIPRERFTVVTGVSGSGKSTLAFDIVFAEGQRRYLGRWTRTHGSSCSPRHGPTSMRSSASTDRRDRAAHQPRRSATQSAP
jgi:ABC-type glutathione transport system ATPase component